jgi:hypothetical protein
LVWVISAGIPKSVEMQAYQGKLRDIVSSSSFSKYGFEAATSL